MGWEPGRSIGLYPGDFMADQNPFLVPPSTQTAASSQEENPFLKSIQVQAAPAPSAPTQEENPFLTKPEKEENPFLTKPGTSTEGGVENPPESEVPFAEKAWNWVNTPIPEMLNLVHPEHRETVGSALQDVGLSFTTPLNMALTVASLGGEAVVAPLIKAVGLEAAPVALKTVQKLWALGQVGFQIEQWKDFAQTSTKAMTALSEGDAQTAKAEAMKAALGFAGAALGAKEAFQLERELPKALSWNVGERTPVQTLLDDHDARKVELTGDRRVNERQWAEKIEAVRPQNLTKDQFEAALFYRVEHPDGEGPENIAKVLRLKAADLEKNGPPPPKTEEGGGLVKKLVRMWRRDPTAKEFNELAEHYENAGKLDENALSLVHDIKQRFDEIRDDAMSKGLEVGFVEDYISRRWKRGNPGHELEAAANMRVGNFDMKPGELKQRVFRKAIDGELLGYELASRNVAALLAREEYNLNLAIERRAVLNKLLGMDVTVGDETLPAAVLQGSGKVIADDRGKNIIVDPSAIKGTKARPIPPDHLRDYVQVENHHFHKWKYLTSVEGAGAAEHASVMVHREVVDELLRKMELEPINPILRNDLAEALQRIGTAEGAEAFMDAPVAIHSSVHEEVLERLEAEKINPVFQNTVVKGLSRAGSEAKAAAFYISPLHILREGMNAIQSGFSPFARRLVDFEHDTRVQDAVRNGVAFASRNPDMNTISVLEGEGSPHNSLVSKIPLLGRTSILMHDYLWEYTNTLKLEAYTKLISRYKKLYPDDPLSYAKMRAANHVNNVFGVQPWARLGLNQNWRRAASTGVLAPDWFLSQVRLAADAMTPRGRLVRLDMLKMATGIFLMSRLVNQLVSGNPRWDAPMGLALPNGRVFSLRSTPEELLRMVSSPRENFVNRLSPGGTKQLFTLMTGRDILDRQLTAPEETWEMLRQLGPEWMEELWPDSQNDLDASTSERLLRTGERMIGRNTKGRTWAEQLAMKYAFKHRNEEPLTGEKLVHHVHRMQVLEGMRNNTPEASAAFDRLSGADRRAVMSALRSTPLESYFREIPFEEAFEVWQAATPTERQGLWRFMRPKLQHWRQQGSPGPKLMNEEVEDWFPDR